jgi:hypothetical protein
MAHNSIDPEDAFSQMLTKGIRPLEPYPGASEPWKSICLKCGSEVYPRYGTVVTAGKGGCNPCAKRSAAETRNDVIRTKDFPDACKRAGVTALSDYIDAHTKFKLVCNRCGHEFDAVWSPLRQGRGCPKCSRSASSEKNLLKFEQTARDIMASADIKPTGTFLGMSKPFAGICKKCGNEVNPRPSALKAGQGGCFSCGKIKGGKQRIARGYTREEALEIMALRDIEIDPEEPYPGSTKSWPGKCVKCGLPTATSVGQAKSGKGGCRVCHSIDTDSSFAYFEPSMIYLIESEKHSAYKLGISNTASYKIRKNAHRLSGFTKILFEIETEYGFEANYIEQFVLGTLREQDQVPEAVNNSEMQGKGGTETWPMGTVSPEIVWQRVLEQLELRRWPIPQALRTGKFRKKLRRGCSVIEAGSTCSKPHSAKGYCISHYRSFNLYGDPLHKEIVPFTNSVCQVLENGSLCGKAAVRSSRLSPEGMCQTHYWRNYEHGSPTAQKRPAPKKLLGVCSVDGCSKEDVSLGLCITHYHAQRRVTRRQKEGKVEPVKYVSPTCSVEGCDRTRSSLGMCHLHYSRHKAYGSPLLAGRGPRVMSKTGTCRVPECDFADAQKGLCRRHYSREYKRKRRGGPSMLDD